VEQQQEERDVLLGAQNQPPREEQQQQPSGLRRKVGVQPCRRPRQPTGAPTIRVSSASFCRALGGPQEASDLEGRRELHDDESRTASNDVDIDTCRRRRSHDGHSPLDQTSLSLRRSRSCCPCHRF
jgi:hypothetical protein